MVFDEKQLKERAVVYRQLIEYEPFLYLIEEIKEVIKDMGESIITDYDDDRMLDKGIVAGMRKVIETPIDAIKEASKLNNPNQENSEPS